MALKAAIAGTGFIGKVHARSLLLAGAELVGVAASSAESAAAAAEELGAARAFDSAEELVRDPAVDVVHVCTPNHLHLPLAEAALESGKHVICEKPLATDAEGAQRLVDAAAGVRRIAAVPFVYRYYPTVREARERVRGETLHLIHGTYLQDWLLRPDETNWRVDDELGGASRAFADIGSHWCDLAEFISGVRIGRLSARLLTAVPERTGDPGAHAFRSGGADGDPRRVTTEDAALVQFEMESGALGSVVVSQVSAGRKNRLWIELDGSNEAVAFDQERPEELWCGTRESLEIRRRDPAALSAPAARLAVLPAGHPQGYADCFDAFVADVYAGIAGDSLAEGTPTFADGLRAAQITDAVLESARIGQWVDVAPTREAQAVAS